MHGQPSNSASVWSVDILDVIRWLHLALTSVSETTIMKCFAKSGFGLVTGDDSEEFLVQQSEGRVGRC